MEALLLWIKQNPGLMISAITAFATIFYAGRKLDSDTKARHAANYLKLNEMHFAIWRECRKTELARVLDENIDAIKTPVNFVEREFLNVVFIFNHTTYLFAKVGKNPFTPLRPLGTDMANFLQLPLPRRVWDETKGPRDPKYVRFIEKNLKKTGEK